ncbi:MAG: MGMT family protein [Pseudobdellovibrio sp.]
MKKTLTPFSQSVINFVKRIPHGRVATYGQIAEYVRRPDAVRGVSWILHSCSKEYELPWHRVVNKKGEISFRIGTSDFKKQKNLLLKEKIKIVDNKIDLKIFQWQTKPRNIRNQKKSTPQIFN